ncbi:MAG: cyclodeaminase/cyclohydrolase family protein [Candidatus Omnitrophota bacterium]
MQLFLQGNIKEYLKELSERKIVPGGGSASALTAALGAGLNLMVINYSIKSDSDELAQGLLEDRQSQQESLDHLSLLVDEDCKAFRELKEALLSKPDAQKEYIAAAMVPMKICRECHKSMEITARLLDSANRNLLTDVGCASHILKAAFCSAQLNVEINLKYIKDRSFVEDTEDKLKTMIKGIDRAASKVESGLKI